MQFDEVMEIIGSALRSGKCDLRVIKKIDGEIILKRSLTDKFDKID